MHKTLYTWVNLNCCSTSGIVVWHSRQRKEPDTSSGCTGCVRTTWPLIFSSVPILAVVSSRTLCGWRTCGREGGRIVRGWRMERRWRSAFKDNSTHDLPNLTRTVSAFIHQTLETKFHTLTSIIYTCIIIHTYKLADQYLCILQPWETN